MPLDREAVEMGLRMLLSGSGSLIGLAAMLGTARGLGSAGLIGTSHSAVTLQDRAAYLPWLCAGVALLVVAARIGAALVVTHLAQRLIYELGVDLNRKILGTALSSLQSLGAPRLLAGLTEDVATLAAACRPSLSSV